MGLEISKRYSPYKLYEVTGYHGGIQAITFLGNQLSFKKIWHYEI